MLDKVMEPLAVLTRRRPRPDRIIQVVVLLVGLSFVLMAWFLRNSFSESNLSAIGYPGVLFLSFLGSVALVLPVPGLISLCVVSTVLAPLLVGLVAAAGETAGEISGYSIGYGGRGFVESRKFYPTIKSWTDRRGWLVIFLVSIIPNPLFDIVGVTAGATRYSVPKFFVIVLVGKCLKGIMVGYTCYYGLQYLPWVN
jgi:membrane protein YqaA with SNARE-associated domain